MEGNTGNKVKIRLKFKSGEEFEAEGNPEFIEKQRADFLQLIGKDSQRATRRTYPEAETTLSSNSSQPQMSEEETYINTQQPAVYRRIKPVARPAFPIQNTFQSSENWTKRGEINTTSSSSVVTPALPSSLSGVPDTDIRLWGQIVRTDDRLVYLPRKSRLLTPDTAALILLAGAKILLGAAQGYSALLLSKSLKKSGYKGERLDRVLAGEMHQGTVQSEGTKRSRVYLLSDKGFARAYVLANKLAEEWRG